MLESGETVFNVGRAVVAGATQGFWRIARFLLLAVLTLLEPVVRYVFGLAMVLGIVVSVMFEFSAAGPRFPFLAMMAGSLAFGIAMVLYYGLMARLLR